MSSASGGNPGEAIDGDKKEAPPRKKNCHIGDDENDIAIDVFRKKVRLFLDNHMYTSAVFWASTTVSLSKNAPIDVYWFAQCLYFLKEYRRAANVIQSRGLDKTNKAFRYLAAKCLLEANEPAAALEAITNYECKALNSFNYEWTRFPLNPVIKETREFPVPCTVPRPAKMKHGAPPIIPGCSGFSHTKPKIDIIESSTEKFDPSDPFKDIILPKGAIYLLKGRIYEALENRILAYWTYRQAVMEDVFCFEAFDAMVKHQMLTAEEEEDIMKYLPFSSQCNNKEEELLVISIYKTLIKKYCKGMDNLPKVHPKLEGNLDIEVSNAERLYYSCVYSSCFEKTSSILEQDPYHSTCLPLHIACLVELNKANELFQLAHELVELRPELAVSWFAVGCYYYLKGKMDTARRYFARATSRDKCFGPAWIAYGHTFAVENEHDQAVVAYLEASQLIKGSHLPRLYAGLEFGLTSNFRLAELFLTQAEEIAPEDPFLIHERGVVAFQEKKYKAAKKFFEKALARVKEIYEVILADKWEPLYNNLGHTCRKLKKYNKALEYHKEAMLLSPDNASTLASIGFIQAITGQLFEAAESFHKALGIRRDDNFCITMLSHVMDHLVLEPVVIKDESTLPSLLPITMGESFDPMSGILPSERFDNLQIVDSENMETQETPPPNND